MFVERTVPNARYGILEQAQGTSEAELAAESIRELGYAILDAGYDEASLQALRAEFERVRHAYIQRFGEKHLRSLNEFHTVRSPLTHDSRIFIDLALNAAVLDTLKCAISGRFILNQQNALVNPPGEAYSQAAWHRDLPYQHFVASRPVAVNALFCVDDFTSQNGATYILPASHKSEKFPSDDYVWRNALQVEAKAGSFILLDCMLYHCGGINSSPLQRRAVNHVFNIPYFKQQINIPANLASAVLTPREQAILGFDDQEPPSVDAYLTRRESRQ
ncbi:phytanoyl-CoA dioxygenase family protein [Paraburkholderia heleia]|uniref:phytanoyl-CoA dioxygenase family protein n=1 Tax=Paraburkholderia heleia TaxID=634127 RepID=UPI0005AA8053|nr:phytanoyl-CoA dioxygenase family protein [Paraburkholderia heleia]